MRSERPKPLHRLCGRPMLTYVLESLADVRRRPGGHRGRPQGRVGHQEDAGARPRPCTVDFVEQRVQRGTGDATWSGWSGLPDEDDEGDVLVLLGDAPLLRPATIAVAGRAPPQHRCRGHGAHRGHGRPDRLRPGPARPRRPGRADRRAARRHRRRARDRRGEHLHLLLPSQPAGARRCGGSSPTTARASTT